MIFSLGHSNHPIGKFIALAKGADIDGIIDIRSIPASRFCPQYNRANFEKSLNEAGITYLWLGEALGGRQKNVRLPKGQMPDYTAMARIATFQKSIDQLLAEAKDRRVALVCAERNPKDCHRFHLVGKYLTRKKISVDHILMDGSIETQEQVEKRIAPLAGKSLFD